MSNFFCEQLTKPYGGLPSVLLPATLPTAILTLGDTESRTSPDFKAYEWQGLHNSIEALCLPGRPTDTWELKSERLVLPRCQGPGLSTSGGTVRTCVPM